MKLDQLKKNVGWRMKIAPAAIRLDAMGRELPTRNEDWTVVQVTDEFVRIDETLPTPLTTKLGTDAIASFTSDPSRSSSGGMKYGLLLLKVQMYIRTDKITFEPCSRPGERVSPPSFSIADRQVNTRYPVESGLEQRLHAGGYRTRWASASSVPSLELQGWEVVIEPDQHGMPTKYHVVTRPENAVYVKTLEPDLDVLASSPYYRLQPGLTSVTTDPAARALVFRFDGPQNALAFLFRAGLDHGAALSCAMAPGRVDTVVGTLTETGKRLLESVRVGNY